MTPDIAAAMREKAADRRFSLTIFPTSEGKFQASIRSGTDGWWVRMHADPYLALLAVLEIAPAPAEPGEGVFG